MPRKKKPADQQPAEPSGVPPPDDPRRRQQEAGRDDASKEMARKRLEALEKMRNMPSSDECSPADG